MSVRLIKLSEKYKDHVGEMLEEWMEDQRVTHTNHSPWAIFKNDYHDFDHYLANLELKTAAENRVPDSVFFLLDEERDRLLGAVNIRHYLNESLTQSGGHIGLGVRPSERRKGYATAMIRLALEECRKRGIERVLMTCDKDNIGSAKSIMKNGGVLENEFINEEGKIEQRYWIDLHDYIRSLRRDIGNKKIILNCAGAVIVKENRVLFQRRSDNGRWGLVGGLLELNETYEQAALREIREETGLEVQLTDLSGIFHNHNMVWGNGDRAHVIGAYYLAEILSGEPRTDEESLELRFFGKEEIPDLFAEDHRAAVAAYYDGVRLPLLKENRYT